MIPFRTLCAKLRTAIKGLTPEEREALGDVPKCLLGGASYSYRVDAAAFIKLCAQVGICPLRGERLMPLPDPGALCLHSIGAGCAVKRHIHKLECEALANDIGISRTTLWRLEKGLPTSIEPILAVCEFIGVHPFGYLRHERKVVTQAQVKRAA